MCPAELSQNFKFRLSIEITTGSSIVVPRNLKAANFFQEGTIIHSTKGKGFVRKYFIELDYQPKSLIERTLKYQQLQINTRVQVLDGSMLLINCFIKAE